jgi:membrane protein YdbS with pleckstrin-like domain
MSQHVDAAAAWIYRGIWASVVALFRLPPEPPTLPALSGAARSIRPALGFLRYLKFFFWLLFVPGDLLPFIGWLAIYAQNATLAIALIPILVAILVLPDVVAYVAIHLRYDTTWYVLTDRSLRIRRGIWVMHETTISFENVQNVEVRQGPLQRYFGIADVVVQTAGGGARHAKGEGGATLNAHTGILQGLDDAEGVRTLILERVRRSRSAGLGDERVVYGQDMVPDETRSPLVSKAQIAVLREIRDIARRLS